MVITVVIAVLKTLLSEINMSYGKVINGGKPMTKGLTKGINEKLEEFAERHERPKIIANSVLNAFKQKNLSTPTTGREGNNGSFLRAKANRNV